MQVCLVLLPLILYEMIFYVITKMAFCFHYLPIFLLLSKNLLALVEQLG